MKSGPLEIKTRAARPGFHRRAAFLFLWLAACAPSYGMGREAAPDAVRAAPSAPRTVRAVTDGDTLVLDGGEKVRLIGIDAPELHDDARNARTARRLGLSARLVGDASVRARLFLAETLRGRLVRLEYDRERQDRFGRTLAYVYRDPDGLLVNAEMLRRGHAFAFTRFPFAHSETFRRLEREARDAGLGVWADVDAQVRKR